MNETALIILAGIAVATVAIILAGRSKNTSTDASLVEWLKSMDKRLDETTKTLNQSVASSSKTINDSLFKQTQEMLNAQRAIYAKLADSAKSIGEMSEIGKSMKDLQQ